MKELALKCANLTKSFNNLKAVSDIDLEVYQGQNVSLVGPSGCGKTTILRLIAGFDTPDFGTIEVGGNEVTGHNTYVPPEKRRVGMVFQDFALFPHLTVYRNIAYGIPNDKNKDIRTRMIISQIGLSGLESRFPNQISGGEQQRVALARALVSNPTVLLLDEPFSDLDPNLRQKVREEVKELLKMNGTASLFVTHDQEEALFMGDRVAIINQGKLEQMDSPVSIYQTPSTRFAAGFIGPADFLPVTFRTGGEAWTEIGPLKQKLSVSTSEGVEVMVRPTDIDFEVSESGRGRIILQIFKGDGILYRIILDSGDTVHSLGPITGTYPNGSKVDVKLKPHNKLVCFLNGKAITNV